VFFLIICILLILVVLLQKGRGGGLGSAFGGGAGSSAFGARTGDVFTWVTIILTALFLVVAVLVTLVSRPDTGAVAMPTVLNLPKEDANKAELTIAIDDDLSVSPRCSTRGATIRYNIDGKGDPTEKSNAYAKNLIIRPGQTLRLKAFRAGMDASPTRVIHYRLKSETAPVAPVVPGVPVAPVAPATPVAPVTPAAPAAPAAPVAPAAPTPAAVPAPA